ncbi:hypothetical protein [Paenibacillus piri]|uniref:Uncharacterized protein n=1 Tax=Paenibacillus piri TaxID=2547395 RepID=A0A4R5K5V4_9BACL|nr:hypothetical protein [Paenibacillus piri]TDF88858.1 hypothetical protein E1757_35105 [Paenibacillus piri]
MYIPTDSNYETTVAILAEMVRNFLAGESSVVKTSKVSKVTFLRVSVLLQRETEDSVDFELTAELLGTQEFRQIA